MWPHSPHDHHSGSSYWPQANSSAGQGHLHDRQLTDSVVKKPCHLMRKRGPIFLLFFSFWSLVLMLQHVKPKQTYFPLHRVTGTQQGWGWLAPLEMASSTPSHRARSATAACSWLHPGMFEIFPSMELSSLSEQPVVNLYIVPAKPKSPFSLQKLKKAPFSSSCRDNAAFHLMCNCRWF